MDNIFDLIVGAVVVIYYLFQIVAFFTKDKQKKTDEAIDDLKITEAELNEYIEKLKSVKADINDLANRQGLNELVHAWVDLLNLQINHLQSLIVAKAEVTESSLSKSNAFLSISPVDLFTEYHQFKEEITAPDFIDLQTHRRSLFYFTKAQKKTFYLRNDEGFEFLGCFDAFNDFHFVYEEASADLLNVMTEDLKILINEPAMGSIAICEQMLLSKNNAQYLNPTSEMIGDADTLLEQIDPRIRKPYVSGTKIHWDIDEAMQYWTDELLEEAFQLLLFREDYLYRLLKNAQNTKKLKCHDIEAFPLRLKLEFIEQLIIKLKLSASFQDFIAQKKKLALGAFEYTAGTVIEIPISVFMPFFDEWLNRFYKCKFHYFNAHTIENIKWNAIHDMHIKPILIAQEASRQAKQAKQMTKQQAKKQKHEDIALPEDAMSINHTQEEAPLDLSHLSLPQESYQIEFTDDSEALSSLVDHYQISPMAEVENFDFSIEDEDELPNESMKKAQGLSLNLFNSPTTKHDIEFALAVGELFMKKNPKI